MISLPEIKTGDLIELGNHRLLCGTCSNPDNHKKLFVGNEKIDVIQTDPPYGVGYVEGKKDFMEAIHGSSDNLNKFENIQNDQTIQDYYKFSKEWLTPILPYLNSKNVFYIFNGDAKMREFLNALEDCGFHFSQLIIWNKNQTVIGRKDYQPKHELIFYGWKGRHKYYGMKDKSILNCNKPKANKLHPTMKPPQLLRKLIYHSSKLKDIIFDPFGGSGSTLIAAHQLGRYCRMMEIDLNYCSIIIQRFMKLTAKEEGIVIKINGQEII
jgi:DNA modification methylase